MVELLASCHAVVLEVIVALVEDDIFTLGLDIDVAILRTNRAIALEEGYIFEAGGEDFEFDGAAVWMVEEWMSASLA